MSYGCGTQDLHRVLQRPDDVQHETEVQAESVYEAIALRQFRGDDWSAEPSHWTGTVDANRPQEVKSASSATATMRTFEERNTMQAEDSAAYSFSPTQTSSADVVITSNPSGALVFIGGSHTALLP